MGEKNIDVQMLPIVNLRPAAYNPRSISDHEMKKLMRSIDSFGFVEPVLVNQDMTIISGHQRVEAAKNLGIEFVPVIVADYTKEQERALNLAMNRLGGEFDQVRLAALLKEFDDTQRMLSGFDENEIAKALGEAIKREEEEANNDGPLVNRHQVVIVFGSRENLESALESLKLIADEYLGIIQA